MALSLLPCQSNYTDPAVVRVRIQQAHDGDAIEYTVELQAAWCPAAFRKNVPHQHGRITAAQIAILNATFPNALDSVIGIPDAAVLQAANEAVMKHASALGDVLLGEPPDAEALGNLKWPQSVWGAGQKAVSSWWNGLHGAVKFLVIELDLDPELQQYVWESVLVTQAWLGTAAIVRLHDGNGRPFRPRRSIKLALLSRQVADLPDLMTKAQDCLKQLQQQDWVNVKSGGAQPELQQLREDLAEQRRRQGVRPLTLVCICHGDKKGHIELDNGRVGVDPVPASRFGSVLEQSTEVILYLVACSAAASRNVNKWLAVATVVVGMQFELSMEAAPRFAEALLNPEPRALRLNTPLEACRQVAVARQALNSRPFSYIEAATPVIHSKVSVLDEVCQRDKRDRWLCWLITLMMMCAVAAASLVWARTHHLVLAPPPPVITSAVGVPSATPLTLAPSTRVEPSATPAATHTPTVTPPVTPTASPEAPRIGRARVKIAGQPYEGPYASPIELTAQPGQSVRIEVELLDAASQPLPATLARYEWWFSPRDVLNEERLGSLNNVLIYSVPADRRGQLISVIVEANNIRQAITIRLAIK